MTFRCKVTLKNCYKNPPNYYNPCLQDRNVKAEGIVTEIKLNPQMPQLHVTRRITYYQHVHVKTDIRTDLN